jgi:hypothetical protein
MSDQTTDTTAVDTTSAPAVQLQLQDILAAAQCIQLASSRGAFKTEEFTQVGGIYERLVGFLQASGALQPAQPAGETPADQSPAE